MVILDGCSLCCIAQTSHLVKLRWVGIERSEKWEVGKVCLALKRIAVWRHQATIPME